MRIFNMFLNYSCNAKCGFCFNPAEPTALEWKGMPTETAAKLLLDAYRGGCRSVNFIGGEATVRADLPTLVGAARRVGYEDVRLVTNGLKLAEPSYADLLAKVGLSRVDLSLHSHEPAVHDLLLGVPGAFEKASAALANISARGVRTGLNVVVARPNHRLLPETASYFLERGVKDFSFFGLRFVGHMMLAANAEALKVPLAQAAPFVRGALERLEKAGCLERACVSDFTPCLLPEYANLLTDWAAGDNPDELCHPDGRMERSETVCSEGKRQVAGCSGCAWASRCLGADERYLAAFGEAEFRAVREIPKPRAARAERALS